ncbi:hypothetical protein GPALN_011578 [Globodera pallida]|nr:hypothetical protein GPALN_011578 [Globodera pallida]
MNELNGMELLDQNWLSSFNSSFHNYILPTFQFSPQNFCVSENPKIGWLPLVSLGWLTELSEIPESEVSGTKSPDFDRKPLKLSRETLNKNIWLFHKLLSC